jgi:AcrR family transcriptional regulator
MGTPKKESVVRRRQIAQAALALVARQGFPGLTMAGIADQIGLVPSALYRHFKSKDEVIDAILELVREQLLENVQLARGETADPLARLHRLLQRHLDFIGAHPGILPVVFSQEVMGGPPPRRSQVYGLIKAYLEEVANLVGQGQGQGIIRAELAPEAVAVAFLGLIQPAAILWHLSGGEFPVWAEVEKMWQIFAAGISSANYHPNRQEQTHETA